VVIAFRLFTDIWSGLRYEVNVSTQECTIWGPGQIEGEKKGYVKTQRRRRKQRRNMRRDSRIRM
jgi:hypothetical protein